MHKSITIRHFRCFYDFTIDPLERVNLIAGPNNVGKTALLEGLWLHQGPQNPQLGFAVDGFRGLKTIKGDELLWDLFRNFDYKTPIEITSHDFEGNTRFLRIISREDTTSHTALKEGETPVRITAEKDLSTTESTEREILILHTDHSGQTSHARAYVEGKDLRFERSSLKLPTGVFLTTGSRTSIENDPERFSNLEIAKQHHKVIEVLRIIEPRLQNLSVISRGGPSMIFGDIGTDKLFPVPLLGDGVGRLLSLTLAIANARNGIVLVDEIESGLYHMVLVKIWKAIASLARDYDVQIFATTHSDECIRAAHQAFVADVQYDFRLHRLERVDDSVRAITYDQETLEAALETGLEVR